MQSIDTDAQFVYNENGLRIQKTVNGVATKYTLHGKNVVHMTSGTDELHIFYDAQNRPAVVVYNGTAYAYVKSLQGDILAILDENGNAVVSYGYDAWGAPLWCTGELAETLGKVQPFRYRGYVFDEETGLYYLRSRYYNPRWGRFANADAQIAETWENMLGNNQYSYCFNNPANMIDPTGNWPSLGQIVSAVATVAVAAVFVAAVVASAGAVGVAAGVAAASIGATGAMVGTAMTAGTIGTYVVAAGIGACALSNAGEIITGTNIIRDGLMGGNQTAYDTVQTVLNIAGGGAIIVGETNPGVTGRAAKPNANAQNVHKVPTTGTPNTSFDKLYGGNSAGFQRTYYDYNGDVSLQIDFTNHNTPLIHSNPHLHIWGPNGRGAPINLRYLE